MMIGFPAYKESTGVKKMVKKSQRILGLKVEKPGIEPGFLEN